MSLAIITPVKDALYAPSHNAIVELAIEYTRRGVAVHPRTSWLCSNLPRARNLLVQAALETGADRVLFLDDDIVFTVADVDALLAVEGCDVVSGAYAKRDGSGTPVGFPLPGGEQRRPLIEMQTIGLGFALVSRTALELLAGAHAGGIFEMRHDGTRDVGEDELFAARWRALGGRVWLHSGVRLGHIGPSIHRVET